MTTAHSDATSSFLTAPLILPATMENADRCASIMCRAAATAAHLAGAREDDVTYLRELADLPDLNKTQAPRGSRRRLTYILRDLEEIQGEAIYLPLDSRYHPLTAYALTINGYSRFRTVPFWKTTMRAAYSVLLTSLRILAHHAEHDKDAATLYNDMMTTMHAWLISRGPLLDDPRLFAVAARTSTPPCYACRVTH